MWIARSQIVVDKVCLKTARGTSPTICLTGTAAYTFWYWWPKQESWYEVYTPGWGSHSLQCYCQMAMAWHNPLQTQTNSIITLWGKHHDVIVKSCIICCVFTKKKVDKDHQLNVHACYITFVYSRNFTHKDQILVYYSKHLLSYS